MIRTKAEMSSMERVLTTLGHKEPDRVPFFLLLTMHGARELGLSIQEYFSRAEYVAEGQLCMLKKYRHDCLYPFFYAPIEVEAFGGEVLWFEDGPPNAGKPIIQNNEDIISLQVPEIRNTPCLVKMLEAIQALKTQARDKVPIIGAVISPFSLPTMQMEFSAYIELIYEQPELFNRLMAVNQEFCVAWANAQIQAGATAICYFDPLTSPTLIPRDISIRTGFKIAQQTLARINCPTAIHQGQGLTLSVIDDIAATGTTATGTGDTVEGLSTIKEACQGRLAVLGNLNGLKMRHWTSEQAMEKVKEIIVKVAHGGGFILTDNHGEIPWSVEEDILLAISEAVHQWGCYPICRSDC